MQRGYEMDMAEGSCVCLRYLGPDTWTRSNRMEDYKYGRSSASLSEEVNTQNVWWEWIWGGGAAAELIHSLVLQQEWHQYRKENGASVLQYEREICAPWNNLSILKCVLAFITLSMYKFGTHKLWEIPFACCLNFNCFFDEQFTMPTW